MDWVHCNACYRQPQKSDSVAFVMTNCGHLYCRNCWPSGTKDNCKVCGFKCSTMMLSTNMKPEVAIFFSDPIDQIQKHLKQIIQVMNFQNGHRQKLTNWRQHRICEHNGMNEKFQQMIKRIKELESQNHSLKQEVDYLRGLVNHSPYAMAMQRPPQQSVLNDGGSQSSSLFRTPSSGAFSQSGTPKTNRRLCIHSPPSDGHLGVVPRLQQLSPSQSVGNVTPIATSFTRHTPASCHNRSSDVFNLVPVADCLASQTSNLSLYNHRPSGSEPGRSKLDTWSTDSAPLHRQFKLNYPLRPDLKSYLQSSQ